MARLTKEEWVKIRRVWEGDERTGYKWLIDERGLAVSSKAIELTAKKEGWIKRGASEKLPKEVPAMAVLAPKMGRPTDFKEEYIEQVFKFCLLGATDQEIADFYGVTESTINKWKHDYPKFSESMKLGKMDADANVAKSLYERATGYAHEDIHIAVIEGGIVETPIIKRYPPSDAAMRLWLKNRRPRDWKDKVEVKHEVVDPFPPKEVLDAIYAKAMAESKAREERMREERKLLNIDPSSLLQGSIQD